MTLAPSSASKQKWSKREAAGVVVAVADVADVVADVAADVAADFAADSIGERVVCCCILGTRRYLSGGGCDGSRGVDVKVSVE